MPTAWPAKTALKLIFVAQTDRAAMGDDNDLSEPPDREFAQVKQGVGGSEAIMENDIPQFKITVKVVEYSNEISDIK
jgi:hypothetical protein